MQANRIPKPVRPFWNEVLPLLTMALVMLCGLLQWYNVKWGGYLVQYVATPATLLLASYMLAARLGGMQAEYKVALGYLLWYLLTRLINGDVLLSRSYFTLFWLCMSICAALPMAALTADKRRVQAAMLVSVLIVASLTAIATLGIYVAVTGQPLYMPHATTPIEMTADLRLRVWYKHPNIVAALFSAGALFSLYMALLRGGRWRRAAFLAAAAIQYVGIGLTGSRMAMLCMAAGLCLIAAKLLFARTGRLKRLPRVALAVLAAGAALYLSFTGFNATIDALSALSRRLPAAATDAAIDATEAIEATEATEATQSVAAKRDIAPQIDSLGGRVAVYKAALRFIGENPLTLLRGNLDDAYMGRINEIAHYPFAHTHNAFLQALIIGGVPGLALMLWFVILLVRRAARLYFSAKATAADAVLALLPMVTLAHSMLEPLVFVWAGLINVLFFFAAGLLIQREGDMNG